MDLEHENLTSPDSQIELNMKGETDINHDDEHTQKHTPTQKVAYITGIYMNHTSNPHNVSSNENLEVKGEYVVSRDNNRNCEDEADGATDLGFLPVEEQSILKPKPHKLKKNIKLKIGIKQKSIGENMPEIVHLKEELNNNVTQLRDDHQIRNGNVDTAEGSHSDVVLDRPKRKIKRPQSKYSMLHADEKERKLKPLQDGGSKIRTFPCDYCLEIFKRMHLRDEHIKYKHPEYYGKYVCLQCHKRFESRHILYQHRLRTHEPLGEFICPVCNSKFTKQSGLKRHLQIHSDNPKWVCSYCGRSSFLSKGDMERHIRNRHTGEKPYACKFEGCDRRFTSSGDRAKHYLHHTGEKRFQCTVCGLKMHTSGELKQHTWIHTGIQL